jgi:c-di-GMP-binding flagellar brake protein YcgR
MSNRRAVDRSQTIYYSRVTSPEAGRLLGRLVDISDRGMMLISELEFRPGEDYRLRVELPQSDLQQSFLDVAAVVRWCRRDVNPDLWAVGFEFEAVDQEAARLIAHLRRTFSFGR